ncbi:MAG: LytTR family DNA-binding domain-containing protein [Bacteroidota bacterium]
MKQLTVDEGLSETRCFDVFQDSKGYIWIGNTYGVNKYDGKDIMKFDRSNGLQSHHVYHFFEDSKNRIWIDNINGEPMYIKDDVVHNRFTNPELEPIKSNDFFVSIFEDAKNRIWFGVHDRKLIVWDEDTTQVVEMPLVGDSLEYDFFGAIPFEDEIVVVSAYYIIGLDLNTFEMKWKVPLSPGKSLLRKAIHGNKLYLMNLFEAHVFDLRTKKLQLLERKDGSHPIHDCRVALGQVIVSTSNGVSRVKDSEIVPFEINADLDSLDITAVHEDIEGNLWFSTRENGVFSYYDSDIEKSIYNPYCDIAYLEEFGQDSIFIIQKDWKATLLVHDEKIWEKQLIKRDENLFNQIVRVNDELWIFDKYNIHILKTDAYETFAMFSRKVMVEEEEDKITWVGTRALNVFTKLDSIIETGNMFDLMLAGSRHLTDFVIDKPRDFVKDDEGVLWLGGEEGLFKVYGDSIMPIDRPEVKGGITELHLDGELLYGVNYGSGIFLYNIQTGDAQLLSREDGMPTNHISDWAINGRDIWATHAAGICLIQNVDNKLKLIKSYSRAHGIPKGRINEISVVNDICHFVVNGKSYSIKPTPSVNDTLEILMDTKELSYFENESRTIKFDCINLTFGDEIAYEYRLYPLESEWREINREKIDLEYIPAGEYILEVRAKHPMNLYNPIKTKPIHVRQKWYNTLDFRLFVLLLFGFIVYFLIRIKALSFSLSNFKYWIRQKIEKYFIQEENNSFKLKDINGVVHLLKIEDIKFIKSSGNYLEYHTEDKKYVSRMTMLNAVEKFKIWTDIQRVHRSYMVNFKMIEAIDHKMLKLGNVSIPFTDRYRAMIEEKLQL